MPSKFKKKRNKDYGEINISCIIQLYSNYYAIYDI